MKWYIVKKKIKGNYYLYQQHTMRVGGKIKTFNKYIGPAGSYGAGHLVKTAKVTTTPEPAPTPLPATYKPLTERQERVLHRSYLRANMKVLRSQGAMLSRRLKDQKRAYKKVKGWQRLSLDAWSKRLAMKHTIKLHTMVKVRYMRYGHAYQVA